MRNWTWIHDRNDEDLSMQAVEAQCDMLMRAWNALEHTRTAAARHDYDYDWEILQETACDVASERGLVGRDYDQFVEDYVDEELNALDKRAEEALEQQRVIETMLHAVGARVARPYEHWGEEERMMQYLEEGQGTDD